MDIWENIFYDDNCTEQNSQIRLLDKEYYQYAQLFPFLLVDRVENG